MLKRLKATNINGRISCDLNFHSDINILTGKNGSGKTTILKLIWYLISANIERIPREMSFDQLLIETSDFTFSLRKSDSSADDAAEKYHVAYKKSGFDLTSVDLTLEDIDDEVGVIREINASIGQARGSVFSPHSDVLKAALR
jgi:predicted ATP-binding protein involved in virulence